MDSNLQGNIGEAAALKYFVENEYEVYLPFGTATKCDMIVVDKSGESFRVSVKSVRKKNKHKTGYDVKIRQGKLHKTTPFNPNTSDLLFIYIIPENRHVLLQSNKIISKFAITVK